jgi:hypothetical protein
VETTSSEQRRTESSSESSTWGASQRVRTHWPAANSLYRYVCLCVVDCERVRDAFLTDIFVQKITYI